MRTWLSSSSHKYKSMDYLNEFKKGSLIPATTLWGYPQFFVHS